MLYFLGYTINTLTLMGVTLAIGLVVDDAIVVLENVMRWIEDGRPPHEAAVHGMREISFAVIATTVSSVAVFLPLAFLRDTTGRLFGEFAVTVAAAILISGFVALTLSPALCALVLRHGARGARRQGVRWRRPSRGSRPATRLRSGRCSRRPLPWLALGVGLGRARRVLVHAHARGADAGRRPRHRAGAATRRPRARRSSTPTATSAWPSASWRACPRCRAPSRWSRSASATPGLVNQGFLWVSLVPREERARSQREVVEALREPLGELAGIQSWAFEMRPLAGFLATPVELTLQGSDIGDLKRTRAGDRRRPLARSPAS